MKWMRYSPDSGDITLEMMTDLMVSSFTQLYAAYNIYEDLSEPSISNEVISNLLEKVKRGDAVAVVCIDELGSDPLVGINFLALTEHAGGGKAVGIGPFAVHPMAQGKGISKLFWTWLYSQHEWQDGEWKRISLVVDSHNISAFSSYVRYANMVPVDTYHLFDGKRCSLPSSYTCTVHHHMSTVPSSSCHHHDFCRTVDRVVKEFRSATSRLLTGVVSVDVKDYNAYAESNNANLIVRPMTHIDIERCAALSHDATGLSSIHPTIGKHGYNGAPYVLECSTENRLLGYTCGFDLDNNTYSESDDAFVVLLCGIMLINYNHKNHETPWLHVPGLKHPSLLKWCCDLLSLCKMTVLMTTPCDSTSCKCLTCCRRRTVGVLLPSFSV